MTSYFDARAGPGSSGWLIRVALTEAAPPPPQPATTIAAPVVVSEVPPPPIAVTVDDTLLGSFVDDIAKNLRPSLPLTMTRDAAAQQEADGDKPKPSAPAPPIVHSGDEGQVADAASAEVAAAAAPDHEAVVAASGDAAAAAQSPSWLAFAAPSRAFPVLPLSRKQLAAKAIASSVGGHVAAVTRPIVVHAPSTALVASGSIRNHQAALSSLHMLPPFLRNWNVRCNPATSKIIIRNGALCCHIPKGSNGYFYLFDFSQGPDGNQTTIWSSSHKTYMCPDAGGGMPAIGDDDLRDGMVADPATALQPQEFGAWTVTMETDHIGLTNKWDKRTVKLMGDSLVY